MALFTEKTIISPNIFPFRVHVASSQSTLKQRNMVLVVSKHMTLEFLFEKWCHSYSHRPLTDHLLNTRNFASCWVTNYSSWTQ